MDAPLPYISPELLKALTDTFPPKDFGTDKSLRDIDFYHGQRSVVNFLEHQFNIQNENILTKD